MIGFIGAMIIEKRNLEIKYPRAIKEEKTRIILDWLLEFRFSSRDILAKRLGSNKKVLNGFFKSLIDQGVISQFGNVHTKNQKYLMLTSTGVSYLESMGRDISIAQTKVSSLGKSSQVLHNLSVQCSVLNFVINDVRNDYVEVVWDRNIKFPKDLDIQDRPDVLIKSKNDYWIAVEYERWRKANNRIFNAFSMHGKAISNRVYSGVIYFFNDDADRVHYQNLFYKEEWPRYKKDIKTGRLLELSNSFKPSSVENLQQCYRFIHQPILL